MHSDVNHRESLDQRLFQVMEGVEKVQMLIIVNHQTKDQCIYTRAPAASLKVKYCVGGKVEKSPSLLFHLYPTILLSTDDEF